ncbi:MAG: hypothetical protein FJW39_33470 [Acidobacteria bacterium]|nr:hypothetical protein [Acidobacteriota bacterium]
METRPSKHVSPNAPSKEEILGTIQGINDVDPGNELLDVPRHLLHFLRIALAHSTRRGYTGIRQNGGTLGSRLTVLK